MSKVLEHNLQTNFLSSSFLLELVLRLRLCWVKVELGLYLEPVGMRRIGKAEKVLFSSFILFNRVRHTSVALVKFSSSERSSSLFFSLMNQDVRSLYMARGSFPKLRFFSLDLP